MLLHGKLLQQRGQPQADFVGQRCYLKALRKLQGASVTEDLGECNVRAIKITQESIRNVVLPPWEPLGVFLDACFEEEDGVMACHLDLDPRLDGIGITPNDLSEVGLAEPSCQRRTVGHQEGTIPSTQVASQHVDPRRNDGRDVLEEVVGCSKP